ncbi:MAG: hypothetical protein JSW07_19310 [bacterium]|nr:MAG: hypothetical protein JSW07_19310 [bacterium]
MRRLQVYNVITFGYYTYLVTKEITKKRRQMEKTWKPMVAGILDIVTGAFALLSVIGLVIGIVVIESEVVGPGVPDFVTTILWILAIPFLIIGVLAIIGGIYSLQRKKWGLALAGTIATIVYWFFVGIPAIVFISQSKDEFE